MRVCRKLSHAEIIAMRDATIAPDDPYMVSAAAAHIPYRKVFEPHDDQTRALIRQYGELCRLPHGDVIAGRLDEWRTLEARRDSEGKQRYLEPLITAVCRDPRGNEDKLLFLLIVFEPVRRGVSRAFINVRQGLDARPGVGGPRSWHQREETRRLHEIERQTLYDVTRAATLDALYRYPTPGPDRLFPWLQSAIAHAALDHLGHELPQIQTTARTAVEAEEVQAALHGLMALDPPKLRDAPGRCRWRSEIDMRSVFATAERYFEHGVVQETCRAAVGRLPKRQAEVIDHLFFCAGKPDELAQRRGVARSTIDNHKAQAIRNLHADDVFFSGLQALGKVRDRARARAVNALYPDGVLPDGRRIVVIEQAA